MRERAAHEAVFEIRLIMEAIARWCDSVAEVIDKKEHRTREGAQMPEP
jgi:hypothetical protein